MTCLADKETDNLLKFVEKRTIEACAKIAEPKGPRPCDCTRCDCGNQGDAESAASWDAAMFVANQIRASANSVG